MSSGRRRPGSHAAAVLLLVGTIFLGVGVLLYLGGGGRALVAADLGDVPGSTTAAAAGRPLAEDIPVLSGLDDPPPGAVTPPGTAPPSSPPGPAPAEMASREPAPVLTDPTFSVPVPRAVPRPLPAPAPPLAPQQPGLVSALYPLPAPAATPVPRAPLVPVRLELPARSVVAPVDAVGTGPSGGMVVPEQVRTVGWWAPGVLPGGGAGSAVVAGHVDSRTEGLGVLSVLPQLTEGEPVLLADASGRTVAYRVAARREYRKYDLPRDVFRRDGPPQLVLVTCGGVFDPAARSYESNIVVYAVPA